MRYLAVFVLLAFASPAGAQVFVPAGPANVTSTTNGVTFTPIVPTAPPTSAPTAPPTTKPTAPPTAPPTAAPTVAPPVNGHYWPASVQVFPKSVIWSSPLPANPKQLANSAAIANAQFPVASNASGVNVRGQEAGQYDYGHPVYYAAATDPLVTGVCTQYCNAPDNGGVPATFRVPAKARPAGGSDSHLVSIQPDGTSIEAWGCQKPTANFVNGSTLTCANIANAGNISTGTGQATVGPWADAMNSSLMAGLVTPAELITGQINHALFITGGCAVGAQYPAPPGSGTGPCTSGVGPPLGARMQYIVPCATTKQNTALHPWEVAILCALNVYGGYMGDDGGGAANFTGLGANSGGENAEAGFQFGLITSTGVGDDMAGLAPQNWNGNLTIANTLTTARWYPGDHIDNNGQWLPPGVTFRGNIIWLDPCVTARTC